MELPDAELLHDPHFLDAAQSQQFFETLQAEVDWEQEELLMFGRLIPAPRLTAWYGDPGASYRYSGIDHEPLPWLLPLAAIRARLRERLGLDFNSVLCNLYRDGQDSVSWHADDERGLGPRPQIASVSLGATRVFQLKHRQRKDLGRVDLELAAGSLLVMGGRCQRHWLHQVPKRRGLQAPRINLTFRQVELPNPADPNPEDPAPQGAG